jgi:hypothetical protein
MAPRGGDTDNSSLPTSRDPRLPDLTAGGDGPSFHLGAKPNAPGGKLGYRPGKQRVLGGDHIDALATEAEHVGHFCNADKLVHSEEPTRKLQPPRTFVLLTIVN